MRTIPRPLTVSCLATLLAACGGGSGTSGAPTAGAVAIDADDIGGTVNGPAGREAGVWVIAETQDLGTRYAKIVVTDDQGRYVVPDLPDAAYQVWVRGSQWEQESSGDPTILALSAAPGYVYALGDATNLYNSAYEESTDIVSASRSVIWLAPDTIVVYDRAAAKTDGRFKRFWLNLPADATVDGSRTTMTTASGQQLVIDTLLPSGASPIRASWIARQLKWSSRRATELPS